MILLNLHNSIIPVLLILLQYLKEQLVNFLQFKPKTVKGKQNLTIFYDEGNLKALTNIQTHVVNVLQSYQKLYEEDKSEVELEKTG